MAGRMGQMTASLTALQMDAKTEQETSDNNKVLRSRKDHTYFLSSWHAELVSSQDNHMHGSQKNDMTTE